MLDWTQLLMPILGVAGAIGAGVSTRFVNEGERAIKIRFGRALREKNGNPRVVEPGWNWVLPGVHKLRKIHGMITSIPLPLREIIFKDGLVYFVNATLEYTIPETPTDLYDALVKTPDVKEMLILNGPTIVYKVLTGLDSHELIDNKDQINAILRKKMQKRAKKWGILITDFSIGECKPTDQTTRLIQTPATVKARTQALMDAAAMLGFKSVQDMPIPLASVLLESPFMAVESTQPAAASGNPAHPEGTNGKVVNLRSADTG